MCCSSRSSSTAEHRWYRPREKTERAEKGTGVLSAREMEIKVASGSAGVPLLSRPMRVPSKVTATVLQLSQDRLVLRSWEF